MVAPLLSLFEFEGCGCFLCSVEFLVQVHIYVFIEWLETSSLSNKVVADRYDRFVHLFLQMVVWAVWFCYEKVISSLIIWIYHFNQFFVILSIGWPKLTWLCTLFWFLRLRVLFRHQKFPKILCKGHFTVTLKSFGFFHLLRHFFHEVTNSNRELLNNIETKSNP